MDPIELTVAERNAGVGAIESLFTPEQHRISGASVMLDRAIAAINRVRDDPVGTIRRHPRGNVMVRTEGGWVWVGVDDGDMSESGKPDSSLWPIIYTPGEA